MKRETHTTTINHLRVYYQTAGERSNPVLVFMHAWGAHLGSSKSLNGIDPVIVELAKYFYVIAPEHAGLLRSETPTVPNWSFADYAQTLVALLEICGVEKPIIVGNSFGGAIATVFASLYPDKLSKLILLESGVSSEYPRTTFIQKRTARYVKRLRSKMIPDFIKKIMIWNHQGKPFSFLTTNELTNEIAFAQNFNRAFTVDYKKITTPTILLWGSYDTTIHPVTDARYVAKTLPVARLVEYPGTVDTIYKNAPFIVDLIRKNI